MVRAELVATVLQVDVDIGRAVDRETQVALLESMKMEIPVLADRAGVVTAVHVAPGRTVQAGDEIAAIAAEP
ncbi:biotin/lipoyl-binding carrier protein [Phycicoccus sp. CSK15P-2]|nr:biotin/lipoyl-binding carrier protein [Phycicoccus sp. CSK15P-2]